MEIGTVTEFISSVGFPIAACAYMMIVNTKTVKENTAATNKMVTLMERVLEKLDIHTGSGIE